MGSTAAGGGAKSAAARGSSAGRKRGIRGQPGQPVEAKLGGDTPLATYVEARWADGLGDSWTPLREAWQKHS